MMLLVSSVSCGASVVSSTDSPDAALADTKPTNDSVVTNDVALPDAQGTDTGANDFNKCSGPTQCTLNPKGCCSPCGATDLSMFSAVSLASQSAFQKSVCPVPEPCPKCATLMNPNHQAHCINNECTAVDIRSSTFAECTADADCMVRTAACCECGNGADASNLIALAKNKAGAYEQAVCDPMAACKECLPVYPSTIKAVCDQSTKKCKLTP